MLQITRVHVQFLILLYSETADLYKLGQVAHCFGKGMCLVMNTEDFFNHSLSLLLRGTTEKGGTSEKTSSVSNCRCLKEFVYILQLHC